MSAQGSARGGAGGRGGDGSVMKSVKLVEMDTVVRAQMQAGQRLALNMVFALLSAAAPCVVCVSSR